MDGITLPSLFSLAPPGLRVRPMFTSVTNPEAPTNLDASLPDMASSRARRIPRSTLARRANPSVWQHCTLVSHVHPHHPHVSASHCSTRAPHCSQPASPLFRPCVPPFRACVAAARELRISFCRGHLRRVHGSGKHQLGAWPGFPAGGRSHLSTSRVTGYGLRNPTRPVRLPQPLLGFLPHILVGNVRQPGGIEGAGADEIFEGGGAGERRLLHPFQVGG